MLFHLSLQQFLAAMKVKLLLFRMLHVPTLINIFCFYNILITTHRHHSIHTDTGCCLLTNLPFSFTYHITSPVHQLVLLIIAIRLSE